MSTDDDSEGGLTESETDTEHGLEGTAGAAAARSEDRAPVRGCPTGPLTVSHRVIVEMVRVAALEVPGVLRVSRGGSGWRGLLSGSPVQARLRDGRVQVRIWIVARPGQRLRPLAAQVRQAVGATIERLLGLELYDVTVVVDGVGGWGA